MLLGFALGLAALGLVAHRHRRWHRRYGYAYGRGCGPHGPHHGWHDDWDGGPPRGRWRGGPWRVMAALGTTPGQEKVIREEADRLRERARLARDEARAARADLAEVLRADTFDRAAFDAALGRVDAAWASVKAALGDSTARIHDTLDARQRERLADLLASRRGPAFGPYRV